MPDDAVPDALDDMAMMAVCPGTISAWLWSCDEHDVHGVADTKEEAARLAGAHTEFEQDPGELCDTVVWLRVPQQRLG